MEKSKALTDYTDKELRQALRDSVSNVQYSPNDYREEMFRRSQDNNTKALNTWTFVIALATLFNTLIVLVQLLKNLGLF